MLSDSFEIKSHFSTRNSGSGIGVSERLMRGLYSVASIFPRSTVTGVSPRLTVLLLLLKAVVSILTIMPNTMMHIMPKITDTPMPTDSATDSGGNGDDGKISVSITVCLGRSNGERLL